MGFWIQDSGFKIQDSGFKIQDSRFKIQDSGFKIQKTKIIKNRVMSKAGKFEDLEIFQKARELSKEIYKITGTDHFRKDTRLVQQMHAAVGSIMDNIAEGYERDGNKEFLNFLYFAKGSCGEVRSQIIRATDVGYLEKENATKLYNDCLNLSKQIAHFIKSIRESKYSGRKYQEPEP